MIVVTSKDDDASGIVVASLGSMPLILILVLPQIASRQEEQSAEIDAMYSKRMKEAPGLTFDFGDGRG